MRLAKTLLGDYSQEEFKEQISLSRSGLRKITGILRNTEEAPE